MVLQGKPEEEKRWSVPSGGRLPGESFEDCCRREVWEETGYVVEPREELFVKSGIVHYFRAELVGGSRTFQDPDGLIYDIAWKTLAEVRKLALCFEEDREFLERWLEGGGSR
jgi:8-oxo-dGTP pyrophosphatase MutT (NUDIX family)